MTTKYIITDWVDIEDFPGVILFTETSTTEENLVFIPKKNIKDVISALQAIELKQIFEEKEDAK